MFIKLEIFFRSLFYSFVGASLMVIYALMYELTVWLSNSDGYESTGVFLALVYLAVGGAIGGGVAGMTGLALTTSLLYSMSLGQYYYRVGPSLDFPDYFAIIFLVVTLIVILRCFVSLAKRVTGFDLSKETLTATIIMLAVGMGVFVLLHPIFLPTLWDKFLLSEIPSGYPRHS